MRDIHISSPHRKNRANWSLRRIFGAWPQPGDLTSASIRYQQIIAETQVAARPIRVGRYRQPKTFIYHQFSSCFRSRTEAGFSDTKGSSRSASRVAHSIHSRYFDCLSAGTDRDFCAYNRYEPPQPFRTFPAFEPAIELFPLFLREVCADQEVAMSSAWALANKKSALEHDWIPQSENRIWPVRYLEKMSGFLEVTSILCRSHLRIGLDQNKALDRHD